MRNNLLLILPDKKEQDLLLKRFISNYNLYIAGNWAEVLHLAETISIQLIICSVEVPGVNGWELCSQLKSALHLSHIPVILLTADDSFRSRIKNLESGADAFVNRPYPVSYLEALVSNLLANRAKITAHVACYPFKPIITAHAAGEDSFIKRLHDHIYNNVHNCSLNVPLLARLMNMSRAAFYRKIKTVTDLTPNDLINKVRLSRAAELLQSAEYKVNEVARMTGFHSQSSFAKTFIKTFKVTPTGYRRMKMKPKWQKKAAVSLFAENGH
ncbi:helix-turn-helix domain-containing protein [Longitalea luteola]|uniref:helix-turn-helix domain-containing protein n=1 Tax=Longitalea luteola TaxID=2812563 RepID=UPI001A96C57F|nr:helix-turn-helix domain-containing protein [Longitalea luteola]